MAGLSATLARSPAGAVLIEFWLGGFDERGISPRAVLGGGYRDAGFSVALLQNSDHGRPASDYLRLVARPAKRGGDSGGLSTFSPCGVN